MSEHEFEVGDMVTVELYSGQFRCQVKGLTYTQITKTPSYLCRNPSGPEYSHLTNIVTNTTGKCIVESKFYEPTTEGERLQWAH